MIEFLTEPFMFEFMQRAFSTSVVAAVLCAVLSCWLVLMGWSLMGDAVSHAVLPGVVLAYIVGIPFTIGALVFGFVAVALIGGIRDQGRIKEDAAMGIVFTTLFAFGLVLVSVTPSHLDLNHIVFGNLLGVTWGDFTQIVVVAVVALAVLLVRRRDITLLAFDPQHARAIGINPRVLTAILLGILALTSVVALQVVGVVLVVAMLIIPGATARLLTDRFSGMLWISPTIAALCAVVGVYTSYYADTATGPTIVVCMGVVFAVVQLWRMARVRMLRASAS